MMNRLRIVIILLLLAAGLYSAGQSRKIDSLRRALATEKEDTNKVNTLNLLAYKLYSHNPDTTIILAKEAYALSEKLSYTDGKANAMNYLGIGYFVKGDIPKCVDNFQKSYKLFVTTKNLNMQARVMGNLANVYQLQGDFAKCEESFMKVIKVAEQSGDKGLLESALGNAGVLFLKEGSYLKSLEYSLRALEITKETKNLRGQCLNLANVGSVYYYEEDYGKALDYSMQALKIAYDTKDKVSVSNICSGIGNIYFKKHDYKLAIENYNIALSIARELNNKGNEGIELTSIGAVYGEQGKYDSALDYFLHALAINRELGVKPSEARDLEDIGMLYLKTGKYDKAKEYLNKAITLDSLIGSLDDLRLAEEDLSKVYDTTGNYKLAFYWYKKATILKDTLFNIDKDKALTRKEMTYKFEQQKDSAKASQDIKDALTNADKNKQAIIRNGFIAGFVLMLALAFFIFRGYSQKRRDNLVILKQKREVEQQKIEVEHKNEVIEEKNRDILSSIAYAKRLQDAILPPMSLVKEHFPQSFILYQPKDIVAGDFYWMQVSGDNILIAACDCTGHGVPGAMVSVVCSNALNRAVKEFHITDPGKILDKVRELVLETFASSVGVQDGMDVTLCSLNKKTKEIAFSGAYNPLIYIHDGIVEEVAADKQPVGQFDKAKPFNTYTIAPGNNGGCLYLFTDGYADQFGGPSGKKFKYKQLQELLLANSDKPMEGQKTILENKIEEWRGGLEQVDDILIIGIRV